MVGSNSNSNSSIDWASRFKQKSADSKRSKSANDVEQSDRERARVYAKDSKSVNPIPYIESRGFVVKKVSSSSFSVRLNGDEYYRLDNTRNGWLWCDQYGNRGGDNIDLVKEIDGSQVTFVDAVYALGITERGYSAPVPAPVAPVERNCEFEPSENQDDIKAGRRYLYHQRDISGETVVEAERQGFLAYAYGAVAFIGRSLDGLIKAVTKRLIYAEHGEPNKRDVKGSVKAYAPILHGDAGSKTVWIVEGGTDALALHDIAMRDNKPRPTVIVSGGAGARAFIDMPHIQLLLKTADKVVVACDREKSAETQSKTDDAHVKQVERLASIGVVAKTWMPPVGCKDVVELNSKLGDDARAGVGYDSAQVYR